MSEPCSICQADGGPCELWHALAEDLVAWINKSGATYHARTGSAMHPWQMAQALLVATGSFVDQCWTSREAYEGECRAIQKFWEERRQVSRIQGDGRVH